MLRNAIWAVALGLGAACLCAGHAIADDEDGTEWWNRVINAEGFYPHVLDPYDVDPILPNSIQRVLERLEKTSFFEVGRADAALIRAAVSDKTLRDGRYFVVRAVTIVPYSQPRVYAYDNKIWVGQHVAGSAGKPRKSALLIRLERPPDEVFVTWGAVR